MEGRFWPEIRMNNHDNMMGNMFPVITSKVHNFLQKNQTYVWNQDEIYLAEHMMVGLFQFGKTERKKLKYPNIIDEK